MKAIMKRDLLGFFTSPIGYVIIAAFLLMGNYFFYSENIGSLTSSLSYVFSDMTLVLCFTIPLVTMRLLSEEKKQKTDQMLLTAPIHTADIVLGKFFAAYMVFLIAFLGTLTWPLIVSMFGTPTLSEILGNYVAMLLIVGALVSMGLFISSLTENQIIAAIISFVCIFATFFFSTIASALDNPLLSTVLNWLSVFSRYQNFTNGIFSLADIMYYISLMAVFLFLTTRVIEKRRWA